MDLIRRTTTVKSLTPAEATEAVTAYLKTKNVFLFPHEKEEVLARLLGHKDKDAYREYQRNAEKFFAFRANLSDYDAKEQLAGDKTFATAVLFEGQLDDIQELADKTAAELQCVVAVFDGNGMLRYTADYFEDKPILMVGHTLGPIHNPDAKLKDDIAEDIRYLDGNVARLTDAASFMNCALESRRKSKTPDDAPQLLFIANQETNEVLWREYV